MRIEIHPEATAELDASALWYERQSARAANEFVVAVDLAIENISKDPDRFALIDELHRTCRIPRFPFQIIFNAENNCLNIIAIAHSKRRPGYWEERTE